MSISYDHLSPLQRAQLRHCRPDLFGYPICQRCGWGQVIARECTKCGAEHDKWDNLIGTREPNATDLIPDAVHQYRTVKFQ